MAMTPHLSRGPVARESSLIMRHDVQCKSHTFTGARCLRWTSRGDKCAQHLRLENGLEIAPSTITEAGLGLFTTIARRKGDNIIPYCGTHTHLAASDERYGGEYVLQLTRLHFIDAAIPSSRAGRYSNTARSRDISQGLRRGNNAHFTLNRTTKTACITATRNIHAGEEVFTAYGSTYRISPIRPHPILIQHKEVSATPASARRRRNSV